jgi:NitT/TauT family transport system ATP-binding protein
MEQSMGTVRVESLTKQFVTPERSVTALNDVSFTVEGHRFVSLIGPSGCGKSTLLNILAKIDEPTSGRVEVSQDGGEARVGYVFQAPRLLPWRTIMDNMLFVHENVTDETRESCMSMLRKVGLDGIDASFPGQLSGGMQQRAGIARAFSIDPDVLLMDEPFSHLDAITGDVLRKLLHEIWMETKKTVVFVTHDVAEAIELSTQVVILAPGGTLVEIVDVDLPFPRDRAQDEVALAIADLMRRFQRARDHAVAA